MKLKNDPCLRKVLYGLYVALFEAKELSPVDFQLTRLTTILTAIMGVENMGWRVIGITPEAINLLETVNFRKSEIPRRICRGHIVDRLKTTKELFERDGVIGEEEFFGIFLRNDCTVIMLTEQNKVKGQFPDFIPIQNEDASLFSNHRLIGWKHRKPEVDFLRALQKDYLGKQVKTVRKSISFS